MTSQVIMMLLTCWNLTMKNEPYINAEGHQVLEYISPDTIVLNLDFILTTCKHLTKGMPYLKVEKKVAGEDISAVKLNNFQDYEGIIYLNVQDLKTNRCYNLSWNLETECEGMWFWSLADIDSLSNLHK